MDHFSTDARKLITRLLDSSLMFVALSIGSHILTVTIVDPNQATNVSVLIAVILNYMFLKISIKHDVIACMKCASHFWEFWLFLSIATFALLIIIAVTTIPGMGMVCMFYPALLFLMAAISSDSRALINVHKIYGGSFREENNSCMRAVLVETGLAPVARNGQAPRASSGLVQELELAACGSWHQYAKLGQGGDETGTTLTYVAIIEGGSSGRNHAAGQEVLTHSQLHKPPQKTEDDEATANHTPFKTNPLPPPPPKLTNSQSADSYLPSSPDSQASLRKSRGERTEKGKHAADTAIRDSAHHYMAGAVN